MKKTSIIFILCLLSSFLLFSQEIKVTSPVSGDSWKLGTTHAITWNYNGPASTDMIINVFKDSINQSNFIEQLLTKNDHTENLLLGSKYTTGKYILRIKTSDNLHHGDSGLFDVYDDIKITSPKSGDKWKLGSTYAIKWTFDAPASTDMIINVFKNSISQSNFIEQLLSKNDHSENLSLGSKYAVGKYIIRVKTADSKYYGDSDKFDVIKKSGGGLIEVIKDGGFRPVIMSINVIKPSSTSNWKEGSTQKIVWKNRWTKRKKIKIDLYNYNGTKFIKNIYTRNYIGTKPVFTTQSSYSWKIPKGTATALGYHKIRISRLDLPKVEGFSSKFHISRTTSVKKYKIYAKTINKYRWKQSTKGPGTWDKAIFPVSDPGAGKSRVGYLNYYEDEVFGHHYSGYVYRSHIYFDVSQLKGKGLILKANIHFHRYGGKNCTLRAYKINKKWSSLFTVDADFITNFSEMTGIVQKWVAFSDSNHGLLFAGNHEGFSHNNSSCISLYDNIYLEVEILGN